MIRIFVCFSVSVRSSVLNTEGREPIADFFMVCIQESHKHTFPLPDTNVLIFFFLNIVNTLSCWHTYILPFLTQSYKAEHDQQFQPQTPGQKDENQDIKVSSLSLFFCF